MIRKGYLFVFCLGIVGAVLSSQAAPAPAATQECDAKNGQVRVGQGEHAIHPLTKITKFYFSRPQDALMHIIENNQGEILKQAVALIFRHQDIQLQHNLRWAHNSWIEACRNSSNLQSVRDFATTQFAAQLCTQIEPINETSPLLELVTSCHDERDSKLVRETVDALVAAGTSVNKTAKDGKAALLISVNQTLSNIQKGQWGYSMMPPWIPGLLAHGGDIAITSAGLTPYERVIRELQECNTETPDGHRNSVVLKALKRIFETHVQTICHELYAVLTSPALTLAQHAPRTETNNPILGVFSEYVGLVKPKNKTAAAAAGKTT